MSKTWTQDIEAGWRSAGEKALRADVTELTNSVSDLTDRLDEVENRMHNLGVDMRELAREMRWKIEAMLERLNQGAQKKLIDIELPVVTVTSPPGVQVQVEQSHAPRAD